MPKVQPLPFYIPFFTKKVPLSYNFCWQMVPLLHTSFRTLHLMHCHLHRDQSKNRMFPRLYKVIKFICSALWAISQTQMTDSLPFQILQRVKFLTFHIPEAWKKEPLSGGASPYRTLKGVPPPRDNLYFVSSAEEAQKLINDFETRNTLKFSSYKASKGFVGTGEK